jgi:hypothetical protein
MPCRSRVVPPSSYNDNRFDTYMKTILGADSFRGLSVRARRTMPSVDESYSQARSISEPEMPGFDNESALCEIPGQVDAAIEIEIPGGRVSKCAFGLIRLGSPARYATDDLQLIIDVGASFRRLDVDLKFVGYVPACPVFALQRRVQTRCAPIRPGAACRNHKTDSE